jgi:glycosyltransferase involved in cell wall biosynthesis
MPAYNAEKTIRNAVESLLRNTVPFDLLIVDDCSRIPVAQIIGPDLTGPPSDAAAPHRVEILRLENNRGVVGARNAGLGRLLAGSYEFIAMLDADDIAYPDRFAKEIAFLRANPRVALVGGWARFIDETSGEPVYYFRPPSDGAAIRHALFVNNCTVHSSWMVRAEALREIGLYSEKFPLGEDYELLQRLSRRFEVANLPEYLIDYTISMDGLSVKKRRPQLLDRLRIQLKYFDPRRPNAWIGVMRTLALFGVPRSLIARYRSERNWRGEPSLASRHSSPRPSSPR